MNKFVSITLLTLTGIATAQSTISIADRHAFAVNAGWIDFRADAANDTRVLDTCLSGFAYAADIGWIALDTTVSNLATATIARPDGDGDAIPDTWEQLHFGILTTATTDSDGDGASDTAEYSAGNLPKDATFLIRIISHTYSSASQANLNWPSVPSHPFHWKSSVDQYWSMG